MLSGFYTIASGVLTRQRELDVIGNNLVNAQTPGYRADRQITSAFEMELMTRREGGQTQVLGNGVGAPAAVVDEVVTMLHAGEIKPTDRTFDLAIEGDGYFNVMGNDGTVYLTRNGQFDRNKQGYLVLPGVGQVLGQNGPIRLQTSNFKADSNGSIYNVDGGFIDTLRITTPPANTALLKQENGMLRLPNGVRAQQAPGYNVAQGSLELSNIELNQELTTMIDAQRAFQTCSTALQIIDSMNRKSATQIATV